MEQNDVSRTAMERRIAERLQKLDDESLRRHDAISEYAAERARPLPMPIGGATAMPAPDQSAITRRKFLVGMGAGGLALAGTAVGGALIGSALPTPDMIKMRALLALYEELEKAGLDALVGGGIAAIGAALDLAKSASGAVSAGIKLADNALVGFERLFPAARQGIVLIEGLVSGLAKQVRDMQQVLTEVTGIARPVTDTLSRFFNDLLDKIPFGVGANVRSLVNQLIALIGSVPTFIESLNMNVLSPLRSDWFSDDESKGFKGNLLEPIRKQLLQPANVLTNQVTTLATNWQSTITPINKAIAQRNELRSQIEAVKVKVGEQ